MIAVVTKNSIIRLYDLTGYQITDDFNAGHDVLRMALSPRVDEVLISTIGTDNCIRIAKLENKRINKNTNKTEASKLKYPIKNSSFF